MNLKRRKATVAQVVSGPPPAFAPTYTLELECGHSLQRRGVKGKPAPKTIRCEQCEMALDRLMLATDWATARELRIPFAILRYLENEDHVKSSAAPRGSVIYWRINR